LAVVVGTAAEAGQGLVARERTVRVRERDPEEVRDGAAASSTEEV
jgi:hypothetical protein